MNIAKNSVVAFHYTLRNNDKKILDSSSGGEPLVYIHGSGNIIPGLEKALEGKTSGDKLNVTVAPEDAYGVRNDKMVQSVLKSEFQDVEKIQPGMRFQVETQGGPLVLTVVEIKENEIVVDGNHPLAGETLHFEVEVSSVRDASEEELSHGHVHGPGGHHH